MTRKQLIITADDFGYSADVNAAVLRAYREGVLRFASMMVLRPAAAEAAALAKDAPGLGVGLHLELSAGEPEKAGLRYFFDAQSRASVAGEIRRQIEALLELGIKPTHVDGHLNIHVHPVIFPALCRLAREYDIPRVRLPGGELGSSLAYRAELTQIPLAGVFGTLRFFLHSSARGLQVPRSWGLLRSGMMSEDYTVWLLSRLPEGATEIYFHPCSDPATTVNGSPQPTHQSYSELLTLISPRVRAAVAACGADLWHA